MPSLTPPHPRLPASLKLRVAGLEPLVDALEAHRARSGSWPDSLDQLDPPPAVPVPEDLEYAVDREGEVSLLVATDPVDGAATWLSYRSDSRSYALAAASENSYFGYDRVHQVPVGRWAWFTRVDD